MLTIEWILVCFFAKLGKGMVISFRNLGFGSKLYIGGSLDVIVLSPLSRLLVTIKMPFIVDLRR
jgi:hypothetical protein